MRKSTCRDLGGVLFVFFLLMVSFPDAKRHIALLYAPEEIADAIKKAEELRGEYDVTLYEKPKKLSKYLDRLKEKNYHGFCFADGEIRELQ